MGLISVFVSSFSSDSFSHLLFVLNICLSIADESAFFLVTGLFLSVTEVRILYLSIFLSKGSSSPSGDTTDPYLLLISFSFYRSSLLSLVGTSWSLGLVLLSFFDSAVFMMFYVDGFVSNFLAEKSYGLEG